MFSLSAPHNKKHVCRCLLLGAAAVTVEGRLGVSAIESTQEKADILLLSHLAAVDCCL